MKVSKFPKIGFVYIFGEEGNACNMFVFDLIKSMCLGEKHRIYCRNNVYKKPEVLCYYCFYSNFEYVVSAARGPSIKTKKKTYSK